MRARLVTLLLVVGAAPVAFADPPDGAALYTKRCAGCHGDDGKAATRAGKKFEIADFTAPGWAQDWPVASIEKNVGAGLKGKMPAFSEKLNPAEIHAVSQRVLDLAAAGAPAKPTPPTPATPPPAATPPAK